MTWGDAGRGAYRAWIAIWRIPGRAWAAMMAAGPLSLWLTAGAAMAWTMAAIAYVVMFRPDLTRDQLFWIVMGAHGLVLVALVALTTTELSLRFGKGGVELEVGRGDAPRALEVETRTRVTPVADDGELPPSERIG